MSGSAVSEETFEREVLASERLVIVDFWAAGDRTLDGQTEGRQGRYGSARRRLRA